MQTNGAASPTAATAFAAEIHRMLGAAPPEIQADGNLHRFSITGRPGDRSAWYVFHEDGIASGAFGDWREGSTHKWCSLPARALTPAQRQEHQQRLRKADQQRQDDLALSQASAARVAAELMAKSVPADAHPYLLTKGVSSSGARALPSAAARAAAPNLSRDLCGQVLLMVPMFDATGELCNVQLIDERGTKRPLTGGKMAGCWSLIGPPPAGDDDRAQVIVCEGFATGASLHQATGALVALAFNAGNLPRVAQSLRERWPMAFIVIAADDDHRTHGNPGLTKARAAAQLAGAALAYPAFPDPRPDRATDFNDMHQTAGLAAVRDCIEQAMNQGTSAREAETSPPDPAGSSNNTNMASSVPLGLTEDDDPDWHRNIPMPDDACFYGLVGDVARTAATGTEVNPAAAGLNMMAFLACAIGRGPFIQIGNTWHRVILYTLHVGRSGVGRKGDAIGLIKRIATSLASIDPDAVPKIYSGGLSSREGLAFQVHDGYSNGKEDVPPVDDKRLWVVEPEFANVLHQGKRDGNTLSTAIRDCWDGGSIKPATKTNHMHATDPHICLSGAITPTELRELMSGRDMTNGFANRHLTIFAERTGLVPFPRPTPQSEVQALARRTLEVIDYCRRSAEQHGNGELPLSMDAAAVATYERIYRHLGKRRYGARIDALVERAAPMVQRIAMLMALSDLQTQIEDRHVRAAWAWVKFGIESVRYIFESAAEEEASAAVQTNAQRIEAFLRDRPPATRTDVSRDCFNGHLSRTQLDAALEVLLTASPPRLVVETVKPKAGHAGRSTKRYRLATPATAKRGGRSVVDSEEPEAETI
ncbi:DUF3987 domain-containing protein [Ottowia sp.]|uniref:DUF3987 domain-containing protein n=1 Tax=Ottowia sp. TaxID=1898956 RepID=UPI002639175F|nr:DUF3987 domain-containing protein [Ottowia sp.]